MPLDVITDDSLRELAGFTRQPGGTVNLKVKVFDPAENISVDMFCRSQRIILSDELIGFLNRTPEIEFKLF
jgi:hypothetical protein